MIVTGCIYRAAGPRAGEILRVAAIEEGWIASNLANGEAFLQTGSVPSAASAYVKLTDPPSLMSRPVLSGFDKLSIAANGTATATITGLPAGATVSVDDVPYPVTTAGSFSLRTAMAGTYSVIVDAWPAQIYSAQVVAS